MVWRRQAGQWRTEAWRAGWWRGWLDGLLMLAACSPVAAAGACTVSAAWTGFRDSLVSDDGRVIDPSSPARITTSEGQSYGLFLALVAGERDTFERLLRWTQNNLAGGDLSRQLPAWLWGRRDDGEWGVLDANPASDADLWIAYALIEAGRLWDRPDYTGLGRALAELILARETAVLPGFGRMMLPGPVGFRPAADRWRLNPSYLPVQLFRGLATRLGDEAWHELAERSADLLIRTAPHGFAPDWVIYSPGKGFLPDPETRGQGSYNAIRVYLWVALMSPSDPRTAALRAAYAPMRAHVLRELAVPEVVDAGSGQVLSADGPVGFAHAVLPLLDIQPGDARARRIAGIYRAHVAGRPVDGYYNQMLQLFSQFWLEGRYRFAADGGLLLSQECS
ncbi:UNVERIFIED_CONTAM: bcsZ [Trichonephila clavipes]